MQFSVNRYVVKMLDIIANRKELRTLIYTAMALAALPGILNALFPYVTR